ncbi:hypothetical protein FHR32_003401 [Streptosporangium album]|uniref:Uncharacterized protein n=1 Tax=Streptosporangium album TaxID=47479 RepID=A0A7W7RVQ8_9ACTN|nr:hypothetical protein [Streptosporangium album]MBB4939096.1 hypothetical protein [Streptosporangium album]
MLRSRYAAWPMMNGVPTPQVNRGTSAHTTLSPVVERGGGWGCQAEPY